MDECTGWLKGISILLEWLALEIFDSFRFSNEEEDDENATFLWSLTCQELDLEGLQCFLSTLIGQWTQESLFKECYPHLYSILRNYENWFHRCNKNSHSKDSMPLWYYETICIIPGEYFYEIRYHPYTYWKKEEEDVELLNRMHRQTSRFQAIENCIHSLHRLYFATMAVSKEKNRFYSFWMDMWNKMLDYMSCFPCIVTSELDSIFAQWLLDIAHQPKLKSELYPLDTSHIALLDKAWKNSKKEWNGIDKYPLLPLSSGMDLFGLWQRNWEKNSKWLRVVRNVLVAL